MTRAIPALLTALLFGHQLAYCLTDDQWAAACRAAIERPREVIYNTDGCDALYYPAGLEATPENFKRHRFAYSQDTEISSIFYCPTSSGFNYVTLPTDVGDRLTGHQLDDDKRRNCTDELFAQGTDPLRLALEYAREHGMEIFCSFRMNDTHDRVHRAANPHPLFPPFKAQHPELLLGSENHRPPFCSWTAVDYGQKAVRQRFLDLAAETCRRYELDGIECDFMRHMQLLKSVAWGGRASQSELDAITGMMASLREITQREGRRRGRPMLVAIRVPDSVEYCKAVGIDLEEWLKRGLVDLLITTSYFQLNPWKYSADLARKYGVKFYASLDESRVPAAISQCGSRNSAQSYAARALAARRAGADGVYYFNLEGNGLSRLAFGSFHSLGTKSKVYYATVRGIGGYRPGGYLAGGAEFTNLPNITPMEPASLPANGKPLEFDLEIGDDLGQPAARELLRGVCAYVQTERPELDLELTVNGHAFHPSGVSGNTLEYRLDAAALKPGDNHFAIANVTPGFRPQVRMQTILKGDRLMVYGKNQGLWRRYLKEAFQESIQEGAYCLEDASRQMPAALYHPLFVAADAVRARFTLKVKAADDPDGVAARIADGTHVEIVQFQPDRIALKCAGVSVPFNTIDRFHQYEIVVGQDAITLYADGKELFAARMDAAVNDPRCRLEGVAQHLAIEKVETQGLIIGSLTAAGTGTSLWKEVQLDAGGVTVTDFAIRIDYATPPPERLVRLARTPFDAAAQISVQDGQLQTTAGIHNRYRDGFWQVTPEGNAIVLKHDAPHDPFQRFDLAPAMPPLPRDAIVVAEWTVQPLKNGPDGAPCLQVGVSPPRPDGKGDWEFVARYSTNGVTTPLGNLSAREAPADSPHHFRYVVDTRNGEALLWCDGKARLNGTIRGGLNRDQPFYFIGDGSSGIAGEASVTGFKVGYLSIPQ